MGRRRFWKVVHWDAILPASGSSGRARLVGMNSGCWLLLLLVLKNARALMMTNLEMLPRRQHLMSLEDIFPRSTVKAPLRAGTRSSEFGSFVCEDSTLN